MVAPTGEFCLKRALSWYRNYSLPDIPCGLYCLKDPIMLYLNGAKNGWHKQKGILIIMFGTVINGLPWNLMGIKGIYESSAGKKNCLDSNFEFTVPASKLITINLTYGSPSPRPFTKKEVESLLLGISHAVPCRFCRFSC